MKILVTGAAGFIGSHIAEALLAEGHIVHILDNFSTGKEANIPEGATVHRLDLRDEGVRALAGAESFEVIVHQAAQMDVRKSVADPGYDAGVNILGFLNLMESARANGLRRVLFASTGGAIYGEPEYTPQDENHSLKPLSPYGISKLTTEKYLYFYGQEYGIEYVALRYANIYGPRQNPHGEAGVVAIFAERMLDGRQPVIYGDGHQTRDYVYVGDVVRANLAALHYPRSGVFNVGTGVETSVNALFHALRDEIDPTMPEVHEAGRPGEQRRSVLDNRLTERELGWKPEMTLADGLAATVAWFRERVHARTA